MKNRKNNKGFSLVELIVVVAIMAVLVGVLAPAYLRYVEKSRFQKDASAVAELEEAVKVTLAEETVSQDITAGATYTITLDFDATNGAVPQAALASGVTQPEGAAAADVTNFNTEIIKTVPSIKFASKTINADVVVTFSVTASGAVTVSNNLPTAP